jgi:hypothetical protein
LNSTATLDLDQLLRAPPKLHQNRDGTLASWATGEDVLRFIHQTVGPDSSTLETGAGLSTIVFAMRGAHHICVTPDTGEVERIRAFCDESGISLEGVTFVNRFSQDALPALEPGELDFVLIDGGHGFPIPFLDWFYTAPALRTGGLVLIDDVQLWTARTLVEFLRMEPEWRYAGRLSGRTAVLQKIAPVEPKEWGFQAFVVRHSDWAILGGGFDPRDYRGVNWFKLPFQAARGLFVLLPARELGRIARRTPGLKVLYERYGSTGRVRRRLLHEGHARQD